MDYQEHEEGISDNDKIIEEKGDVQYHDSISDNDKIIKEKADVQYHDNNKCCINVSCKDDSIVTGCILCNLCDGGSRLSGTGC